MRRDLRTRSMLPWTWWCTGSTSAFAKGSDGSWGCCPGRDRRMDQATARMAEQAATAASRPHSPPHPEARPRIRSILAGIGGYLPEMVVTNDELAKTVDTSDAWIFERTGIRQRHLAQKHETCAFMATAA